MQSARSVAEPHRLAHHISARELEEQVGEAREEREREWLHRLRVPVRAGDVRLPRVEGGGGAHVQPEQRAEELARALGDVVVERLRAAVDLDEREVLHVPAKEQRHAAQPVEQRHLGTHARRLGARGRIIGPAGTSAHAASVHRGGQLGLGLGLRLGLGLGLGLGLPRARRRAPSRRS